MRLLLVLLVTGIAGSLVTSPSAAADTPTADPSVATPIPSPSSPLPLPIYEEQPCETGLLINEFIVLGDREPQPSCVEPFTPSAPEILLGINPLPAGLVLRGVERSVVGGVSRVSVVYESVADASPGRDRVSISLQRESLSKPYPVAVRLKIYASEADFLPKPGLLLEPSAANEIGYWFAAPGLYRIEIESPGLPLDIRELSKRLVVVDAQGNPMNGTPQAPATGSGAAPKPSKDVAWVFGLTAVVLLASAGLAAVRRRD